MYDAGDSITAAFLAETSAADKLLKPRVEEWAAPPNANPRPGDNKSGWSWASGKHIPSHFVRLQEHLQKTEPGATLHVDNVARSGALAANLADQARAMERAYRPGTQIKYVTLLIGANDSCQGFPGGTREEVFALQLATFFERVSKLAERNPDQTQKVNVLVSALPRIPDLGRPEIAGFHVNHFYSCRALAQRITHFCNSLVVWNGEEDYWPRLAQVERFNGLIQKAVDLASQKHANLNLHYSHALHEQPIVLGDLATDCFHPNVQGQSKIAELLWKDQPFFK